MPNRARFTFILVLPTLLWIAYAQNREVWRDPSPHRVRFVTVEPNVRLEVLDWGGSGKPLILLNGGGGTAHGFDDFAPKLKNIAHVYAVTRRGFGASSAPATGYEADRLGDDVLSVMQSLKLRKPVLAGESLGGTELSSVGSRHADRVSGLVYLDAGYPYAFDNGKGTTMEELLRYVPPMPVPNESDLASFKTLQAWWLRTVGITIPEAELRQTYTITPDARPGKSRTQPVIVNAILGGIKKYTDIRAPVLAIFATPPDSPWLRSVREGPTREKMEAIDLALQKHVKAFEDGLPSARVVRLAGANHMIFAAHEAEVLKEMRAFLASLR